MAFYHLPMSNIHHHGRVIDTGVVAPAGKPSPRRNHGAWTARCRGFTLIDALFIVAIVATVAAVALQKHVDCAAQMVEASSSGGDIFVRLAHFLDREHGTPWISNLGGVC